MKIKSEFLTFFFADYKKLNINDDYILLYDNLELFALWDLYYAVSS